LRGKQGERAPFSSLAGEATEQRDSAAGTPLAGPHRGIFRLEALLAVVHDPRCGLREKRQHVEVCLSVAAGGLGLLVLAAHCAHKTAGTRDLTGHRGHGPLPAGSPGLGRGTQDERRKIDRSITGGHCDEEKAVHWVHHGLSRWPRSTPSLSPAISSARVAAARVDVENDRRRRHGR
jgi:hypothetical protein